MAGLETTWASGVRTLNRQVAEDTVQDGEALSARQPKGFRAMIRRVAAVVGMAPDGEMHWVMLHHGSPGEVRDGEPVEGKAEAEAEADMGRDGDVTGWFPLNGTL